jgi:hypothetical protein
MCLHMRSMNRAAQASRHTSTSLSDAGVRRKLPTLKSEQQEAANHEKWKNDPTEQYHVD